MPFVLVADRGFFTEEGFEVELIQVNPRLGATAVLNGDIDLTTTFGSTLRAIIGGFPLKFVAVSVGSPSISS
jgi:ABC-type nitrate/sulfonate/bicarbonate transport system substrate-binding protein